MVKVDTITNNREAMNGEDSKSIIIREDNKDGEVKVDNKDGEVRVDSKDGEDRVVNKVGIKVGSKADNRVGVVEGGDDDRIKNCLVIKYIMFMS